jgi:hypothetical protein
MNILSPQTVSEVRSSPSFILPRAAGEERGGGSESFVVRLGFSFCFILGRGFAALSPSWSNSFWIEAREVYDIPELD